jgi:hypothetical protein
MGTDHKLDKGAGYGGIDGIATSHEHLGPLFDGDRLGSYDHARHMKSSLDRTSDRDKYLPYKKVLDRCVPHTSTD